MKNIKLDSRIPFGLALMMGGVLLLAQNMGLLENVSPNFWGGMFIVLGLVFLLNLVRGEWWNAFPTFIFLGLGTLILLPDSLEELTGGIFLGSIALSFWVVYFTDRKNRWWAIIPGGVLTTILLLAVASFWLNDFTGLFVLGGIGLTFLIVAITNLTERWWGLIPGGVLSTLAVMTVVEDRFTEFQTVGIFFFGLAITFLLVALLAKMQWAYYPAAVLSVMGVFGLASLLDIANYVWAIALILIGIFMLFRYFTNRA
jgi:hypothetical protein